MTEVRVLSEDDWVRLGDPDCNFDNDSGFRTCPECDQPTEDEDWNQEAEMCKECAEDTE